MRSPINPIGFLKDEKAHRNPAEWGIRAVRDSFCADEGPDRFLDSLLAVLEVRVDSRQPVPKAVSTADSGIRWAVSMELGEERFWSWCRRWLNSTSTSSLARSLTRIVRLPAMTKERAQVPVRSEQRPSPGHSRLALRGLSNIVHPSQHATESTVNDPTVAAAFLVQTQTPGMRTGRLRRLMLSGTPGWDALT